MKITRISGRQGSNIKWSRQIFKLLLIGRSAGIGTEHNTCAKM